jgi:hypothetical protein
VSVIVRSAAVAAHASSGGTRLHPDHRHHGSSSAPTRDGVRDLLRVDRRWSPLEFKFKFK